MKPRIYADFNKLDKDRNAILVCFGTKKDLDEQNLKLVQGLEVTLYQTDDLDEEGNPDCLEVDAVIEYDCINNFWIGVFEWEELDYRSIRNNTLRENKGVRTLCSGVVCRGDAWCFPKQVGRPCC